MKELSTDKKLIVIEDESRLLAFCSEYCASSYKSGIRAEFLPNPDIAFGCVQCNDDLLKALEGKVFDISFLLNELNK